MEGLAVENLVVKYGNVTAVRGISFDVKPGMLTTLLGPSGCGKTTTLRCIAGLEKADSGSISYDDTVLSGERQHVPPNKRQFNMVFQSYAIWPHMSVFDNVAYSLRIRKENKETTKEKVRKALGTVGLAQFEDRYGTELSGGQQQRVAVARAIVSSPKLLLFDEPLSNLDASLREQLRIEMVAINGSWASQRSMSRTISSKPCRCRTRSSSCGTA